jgi:hypothetical protein
MKPNPAAALEALAVYDERRYKLMSLLTLLRPPPALSRKDVKTASQLKRVRELDDEAMRKFQREVRTNAIDAKILVARKLMDEAWAAYLSARDG